jgi:hypothetical protein
VRAFLYLAVYPRLPLYLPFVHACLHAGEKFEPAAYKHEAQRNQAPSDGGQVWIRAPDNKPLISVEGYHAWVESGPAPRPALQVVTKPPFKGKGMSPPPLT